MLILRGGALEKPPPGRDGVKSIWPASSWAVKPVAGGSEANPENCGRAEGDASKPEPVAKELLFIIGDGSGTWKPASSPMPGGAAPRD